MWKCAQAMHAALQEAGCQNRQLFEGLFGLMSVCGQEGDLETIKTGGSTKCMRCAWGAAMIIGLALHVGSHRDHVQEVFEMRCAIPVPPPQHWCRSPTMTHRATKPKYLGCMHCACGTCEWPSNPPGVQSTTSSWCMHAAGGARRDTLLYAKPP